MNFSGELFEFGHGRIAGAVGQALAQERHGLHGTARSCGDAISVLAREQARRQRTPRGQAQTNVFVESGVLLLHPLAMKEVVLRLLHDRLVQVVALGNVPGGPDVGGAPLAGAPIQRFALANHVAHGPDGLFDRGVWVGPVAIHQVNVVQTKALERAVNGLHEVLAIQSVAAIDGLAFAVQAPKEFGRHHVTDARPLETAQGFAHDFFAFSQRIAFGVVKKIDAGVSGRGHHFNGGVDIDLVVIGHPRTQ